MFKNQRQKRLEYEKKRILNYVHLFIQKKSSCYLCKEYNSGNSTMVAKKL